MHLEAGSRLGPYEITGWIGAGGMGEVYRARDTRLGRDVAIKVLPGDVIDNSERLARFKREACSASALNHRNIVTVHDFTSADDEAWLVMELIRGQSLREILKGPLPLKRLITLAGGISDGLAAAHAAGLVHRDLKPENIMITGDDTPKILDFGLAKQAQMSDANAPTAEMVSSAGVVMGTAAYMSPEQARGEDVDYRTDQFSLGVILQEMATGKHPFLRRTGAETLAAILNDEPPAMAEGYPSRLADITERCLSKNPQERYGSTSDLAHDIRRIGAGAGRTSVPSPGRTRRLWWALVLGVAMLLAAGAALKAVIRRRDAAPDWYQVSLATPELAKVFRDEIALPVALSPDGRYIAVFGTDADAVPALWVHDLRSGAKRLVAQNTFSVAWSPDSKSIAYFADEKLKTVPIDGGPPRIVCDAHAEGIPSWKGDSILFGQYSVKEPGVYRVDADGGKPERVAGPDASKRGTLPFWPEFLPDGKHYLYLLLIQPGSSKGGISHELYVGSLDGKAPKIVSASIDSRAIYSNGNLLFVRDGTLLAQPFDPDQVRLTGQPRALVNDLHYFSSTGLAAFSVSDNGLLAWRAALPPTRLVWFDRSGFELKEIAVAAFQPDGRFSPDGRHYAVGIVDPKQGVSDIWSYDLNRDSSERLTFRSLDEKVPVWAQDGQSIYYRGDGDGPPDIFRWLPGAETLEPVFAGPAVEEPDDVSPDGKTLLFVQRSQFASGDIYVLPLSPKGPPRAFATTRFDESSPRFSPDGRWVAYHSNTSGRPEVYVRPLEAPTAARISKDGGTLPRWNRDGKELFFLAPGGRIMSASMRDGASTGVPRILFQAPEATDFEPANDGMRFLIHLEQKRMEPPVQILINWPARLRSANAG
jgi:Tol biopolymer transport system component